MNDTNLACFFSVAHTGSFTITARELCLTQQAVSRNVHALEQEFGFPLIIRSGQGIELTHSGELFLKKWRMFDSRLALLERQAQRLSNPMCNKLFVGWPDWINGCGSLHQHISGFLEEYHSVDFHAFSEPVDTLASMLRDGSLDIAIIPEIVSEQFEGLHISPVFEAQTLHLISRNYTELPPLRALADEPHYFAVLGDHSQEDAVVSVKELCACLGYTPASIEVMPNVESVFAQLLCGGCTIGLPSRYNVGLCSVPLPGMSVGLCFVSAPTHDDPWVLLFEAFVRGKSQC
ncbi:MAG: LysR family transcriptional regulator [Oscillospiraceae bacterium]|nr:LysR family transcriptional regulator [Oscillospiraceae bacterium]